MNMKRLLFAVVGCCVWTMSADTVFVREKAGRIWQDGLFVGDGRTGAISYAPSGLEWTINRNDIFDSRVWKCRYIPHDEVMKCVATNEGKSVAFLSPAERPNTKGFPDSGDKLTQSLSAAQLKVRFWPGLGWNMPAIPPVRQELDTRTGELRSSLRSPQMTPETLTVIERSRDVMAVDLKDPNAPRRSAIVELTRPDDVRLADLPFSWSESDGVVTFTQKLPGGETYAVAMSAPAKPKFVGRTAVIRTSCGRSVFLAVRTTYDAADPAAAAVAAVKSAERDGFAALRRENREWWKNF